MGILNSLLKYIPTVWTSGDIITAEKLNHMEDGIDNAENGVIWLKAVTRTIEEEGVETTIACLCDLDGNSISYNDILTMFQAYKYIINVYFEFEDWSYRVYSLTSITPPDSGYDINVSFKYGSYEYPFMADDADAQLWQYIGG